MGQAAAGWKKRKLNAYDEGGGAEEWGVEATKSRGH